MSSPPISKRAGGGGDVELGSVHRPTYHDYEAPKEEKEEEEKTDERRQSTRTHPHRLELALVAEYSHVVQSDDRNKRSSVEYAKDATWQMSKSKLLNHFVTTTTTHNTPFMQVTSSPR